MTPTEIIANDPQSKQDGADKVLAAIAKLVKNGDAILFQHGNTVLVIVRIGQGLAEVHLYSTAKPVEIAMAMKDFHRKLLESHIQRIYGTAPANSPIIRLMGIAQLEAVQSDKPQYTWMMNV
jgi:hypothetical protein